MQLAARTVADTADQARWGVSRLFAGDRPFLLGTVGLLVLAALMLAPPFQSYLDGRDRVETLERQLSALETENRSLEERRADLQDPDNIEVLAREQFGLVQPGDVPYVVVPPENTRPQIGPAPIAEAAERPWYRRAWEGITGVFK